MLQPRSIWFEVRIASHSCDPIAGSGAALLRCATLLGARVPGVSRADSRVARLDRTHESITDLDTLAVQAMPEGCRWFAGRFAVQQR